MTSLVMGCLNAFKVAKYRQADEHLKVILWRDFLSVYSQRIYAPKEHIRFMWNIHPSLGVYWIRLERLWGEGTVSCEPILYNTL